MKVLQIVKTSEGARWAFDQAFALSKRGVTVVTAMPDTNGKVASLYEDKGMKVIVEDFSLPLSSPWEFFDRARKIREIVEAEKPDIIHCHFVTNIVMLRMALKNNNIPRVFQVPGPLHLESFLFRNIDILSGDKNDYWIGTCEKTCSIYREYGVPENKLFLGYYGGYGGEKCEHYSDADNRLHKEYGIVDGSVLVGMVSYFYKPKKYLLQTRGLKGHEDFIDAISVLQEKYSDLIGIIIGGPWGNSQSYFEKVKNYAKAKCGDKIIFTGFRSDIVDIYRELNVAVHPSHSENLGGAAESLAAAVPTVSTNIGGFPDIVIDGVTGYTTPSKSPEKLALAIEKMIADPAKAKALAENGRDRVRNLLDIERCADEIVKIYNRIAYGEGIKNQE